MINITEMTKRDTELVLNHLKKAAAIIDRYEANGADYGTIVYNGAINIEDFVGSMMTVNRVFEDSYN